MDQNSQDSFQGNWGKACNTDKLKKFCWLLELSQEVMGRKEKRSKFENGQIPYFLRPQGLLVLLVPACALWLKGVTPHVLSPFSCRDPAQILSRKGPDPLRSLRSFHPPLHHLQGFFRLSWTGLGGCWALTGSLIRFWCFCNNLEVSLDLDLAPNPESLWLNIK